MEQLNIQTQPVFCQEDPSFDASSLVQPGFFLGNGVEPEFLPLSLLEKRIYSTPDGSSAASGSGPQNYNPRQTTNNKRKRSNDIYGDYSYETTPSTVPSLTVSDDRDHFGFGFDDDSRTCAQQSDFSSTKSYSPPTTTTTTHSFDQEDMRKRERHLERNRAAASKSRQKKKRETDQLKNRYQEVSQRKKELEQEIKGLHSKLLYLKDQILMHSRCDDEAIRLYLGQMVKQATQPEAHQNSSASPEPTQMMLQSELSAVQQQQQLQFARMEDGAAFSCGNVEKNMMDGMMCSQPAGNIFDYQISIS